MKTLIHKSALIVIIGIAIAFNSCKKDEPGEVVPLEPVAIDLTPNQLTLIQSGNSFAFDIFRKTESAANENENIMISPLSISTALSMTLNGADGTTRDAMTEALRINGLTPEIVNDSYKNLVSALLSIDNKRVYLNIANSVWTEKNFAVKKPFTDCLTEYYNAESRSFDISDQAASKIINTWIENKTNGLIKEMVDKLESNSVMLLINAIYFKGKWNSQFIIKNTVNKPFYGPSGTSTEVPMMKQKADFRAYKGNGFKVAEFPYGQGNFVMDVILPDENNGLTGIIQLLSESSFNEWIAGMREAETELSFPRFKYGYKKKLKDILSDMGMGVAFTDNADFSNISDQSLLINDVTHQAFIETNEEGTEAAAVTVVDIITTGAPVAPFVFNADHPFIFIIREITTNSILFMGKVVNPSLN
jgi:serine protease inhibitor